MSINYLLGFPGGSVEKNLPASAGDVNSIPGLGRSPGRGNGNSFQYFCQDNPVDGGTWWATVHAVAKELHLKRVAHNSVTKQQQQQVYGRHQSSAFPRVSLVVSYNTVK